jgi:hypothetical protein
MEAQMAGEKHELRRVFDQHAVEGHIVKDELAAMCVDLGRPMNQVWELEAAWRSMDPDELGWVVRMTSELQMLRCHRLWANQVIAY